MADIRSLLDLPQGAELPTRADVEDTLTSGYAYELDLERRRLQLEPDGNEVRELTGRLAHADQELAGVRAMLASLRAQALG